MAGRASCSASSLAKPHWQAADPCHLLPVTSQMPPGAAPPQLRPPHGSLLLGCEGGSSHTPPAAAAPATAPPHRAGTGRAPSPAEGAAGTATVCVAGRTCSTAGLSWGRGMGWEEGRGGEGQAGRRAVCGGSGRTGRGGRATQGGPRWIGRSPRAPPLHGIPSPPPPLPTQAPVPVPLPPQTIKMPPPSLPPAHQSLVGPAPPVVGGPCPTRLGPRTAPPPARLRRLRSPACLYGLNPAASIMQCFMPASSSMAA